MTVRDAVDVLPHSSFAVNVLVWLREHVELLTSPSLADITVADPQPSVAVAVPSAAFISDADGLHPRVLVVPPVWISGSM